MMFDFLTGYVRGERPSARSTGAARAAAGSTSAIMTGELQDINLRLNRLLLVMEAMWSLLREKGYTDKDLLARLAEVEAADGGAEGVRTPHPHRCPGCDAMVEAGRTRCPYCGRRLGSPTES